MGGRRTGSGRLVRAPSHAAEHQPRDDVPVDTHRQLQLALIYCNTIFTTLAWESEKNNGGTVEYLPRHLRLTNNIERNTKADLLPSLLAIAKRCC